MAGTPVETNTPDVKGDPITIWAAAAGTDPDPISLPADAPKIDLRVENPVLSMIFFDTVADANSETYNTETQIARGGTPNDAKEWAITDFDTVTIKKTSAEAGFVGITYIPFGVQLT